MAGKSKANAKKSSGKNNNQGRKKGPGSRKTGQKYKTLAELHGIASMEIRPPEFDEPVTPRSSLIELRGVTGSSNSTIT